MASDQTTAALNGLDAPWRIGVDVGGTFTDMVLVDAGGRIRVFKVPSVPSDPGEGVIAALELAARTHGLTLERLLGSCALFVHGSTIATNTILEGKGAKVGLIVTRGFRDTLEIRRGIRSVQWDHRRPFPPVMVPRYLRRPVGGRIDRNGREIEPLSPADVADALRSFGEEGVESVAIALINSYVDPAHERAVGERVRGAWRNDWVSVSTDIAPMMGEYERTSTTVVNAYIAPRTVRYLQALNERLEALGLPHPILLLQSNGGAVSVEHVTARPVNLVLSGPAAGVGALHLYRDSIGDDLISMEIGGTSCDVALMSTGSVQITEEMSIGDYQIAIPSVDIHSVGAGGGTIAGVDGVGMLFVGPRGAGARPGPACYGFGGTEPTVTDAQLVLGRLRPGPVAGGAVTLDATLAREAIRRKVAEPLGLDLDAAAAGIIRLLDQKLRHAVERISVQRGYDPRRFVLVAAGGAGPMHGAVVGRLIAVRRVYVPRLSGAFCALGMLNSDVRQDYLQVVRPVSIDEADPGEVARQFEVLDRAAARSLELEGFDRAASRLDRALDLRYRGQQSSIRIPLRDSAPLAPDVVRTDFEAEYERQFGHVQPQGVIEITGLRVTGFGLLPPLALAPGARAEGAPKPVERRPVWIDEQRGWQTVPVFAGPDLKPGHRLAGPLVIEEATTTVFVGADDQLQVDDSDNFLIHLLPLEARHGA